MSGLRVVVCLGQIAHQAVLRLYKERGWVRVMGDHPFAHGAVHEFDEKNPNADTPPPVIDTYHPSQQNTFTGRLTAEMLRDVFIRAKTFCTSHTEGV